MARKKRKGPLQVKLRVRDDLRGRLEKAAKASGISVNAEAIKRLEQSFEIENEVDRHERVARLVWQRVFGRHSAKETIMGGFSDGEEK